MKTIYKGIKTNSGLQQLVLKICVHCSECKNKRKSGKRTFREGSKLANFKTDIAIFIAYCL